MISERTNRDDMARMWKQILPSVLKAVHTKSKLLEVMGIVENDPLYRDVYERWETLTLDEMRSAWQDVSLVISRSAYSTRPYCVRCGDCCQESSPVLYGDDLALIADGTLQKNHLVTLRKGEMGFSPKEGRNMILSEEMIKVKEREGDGGCMFYVDNQCSVYANRPLQCRTLECWNPDSFEIFSTLRPLDRKAVLTEEHPLWQVIATHDERSSHDALRQILERNDEIDPPTEDQALGIVLYDFHVRMFVEEKAGIDLQEIDFFFGYPVLRTLSECGYSLMTEEGSPPRIVRSTTP